MGTGGAICLVCAACGRIGFDPTVIADGNSGDAQSAAPLVPGGTFARGYDVAADGMFADATNPATVSDFRLDRYEVTVARFRQFVAAGMGTRLNPPPTDAGARILNGMADQGGWDPSWNVMLLADTPTLVTALSCDPMYASWTDAPSGNEELPINCVTWYEAMAFCVWDGGGLPTEAEWNYAASGGGAQRAYPWSSPPGDLTIDCSYANYAIATTFCVNPPDGSLDRVGSQSPKGDGRWGHADLAGNVAEWTLDWYAAAYDNPCNDCAHLTATNARIARGGLFDSIAVTQRAAAEHGNSNSPFVRAYELGVRCVRPP